VTGGGGEARESGVILFKKRKQKIIIIKGAKDPEWGIEDAVLVCFGSLNLRCHLR
jgi:hypothetical protein